MSILPAYCSSNIRRVFFPAPGVSDVVAEDPFNPLALLSSDSKEQCVLFSPTLLPQNTGVKADTLPAKSFPYPHYLLPHPDQWPMWVCGPFTFIIPTEIIKVLKRIKYLAKGPQMIC